MSSQLEYFKQEPFGSVISLDSMEVIDTHVAEKLVQLFKQEGLLVIRGLKLSHEEQIRFCRYFGPVPDSQFENFLVSNVESDGHLGARELLWHNDVAYLPSPYLGASLHALNVADGATGTRFVSGYLAYEQLSEKLKERVQGLKALQVRERVWDRPNRLTDLEPGDMCTVHSVVRYQSETNRPFLFVNQDMTANVIGLSDSDSDQLLADIYEEFYRPCNVYEHKWSEGDLVLWDNLAIQHSRGQAGEGVRTLQRVTITDFGYAEQYPADAGIYQSLGNAELNRN